MPYTEIPNGAVLATDILLGRPRMRLGVVFIRRVLHWTALDTMDDAELERWLGRSIQALIDR